MYLIVISVIMASSARPLFKVSFLPIPMRQLLTLPTSQSRKASRISGILHVQIYVVVGTMLTGRHPHPPAIHGQLPRRVE